SRASVHAGHRHAVRPIDARDVEIPAARQIRDLDVTLTRFSRVIRGVEDQTRRPGPGDLDLAVRADGRYCAFVGVVAVLAITGDIRDAKRHRKALPTVDRP